MFSVAYNYITYNGYILLALEVAMLYTEFLRGPVYILITIRRNKNVLPVATR